MTAALHVAGNDLLRFLRRRDTFWVVAMGLAGQLFVCLMATVVVADVVDSPEALLRTAVRVSFAVEWVTLGILAYYVAFFGQRAELEGSWILLRQTPVPLAALLGGKALGASACCLVVHAALLLPWAATPVPGAGVLDPLWALLYAVTLVPEAMLLARIHAQAASRYVAVRGLTLLRILMPLALMALAMRLGPSRIPPTEAAWRSVVALLGLGPTPLSASFPEHLGPLTILFGWQLVTALPIVAALLRSDRP